MAISTAVITKKVTLYDNNNDGLIDRLYINKLKVNDLDVINLLIDNLIPSSDNTSNIGTPTLRYANLYAVNIYAGDVIFENNYRISEYDDKGNLLNGLRILDDYKNELFKITQEGIWFKGTRVI